jgi:hypothetical protein
MAQSPRQGLGDLVPLSELSDDEWRAIYESEHQPTRVAGRTRKMLELAQRGLRGLSSGPVAEQLGAVCDAVVYGRSVTLAAQHAKGSLGTRFSDWYDPWRREFENDDLFRYFNRLRTEIVHEGAPRAIAFSVPTDYREYRVALRAVEAELPGVRLGGSMAFWMTDSVGIGAYELTHPDGRKVTGVVQFPPAMWQKMRVVAYLPEPPKTHRGRLIADVSLQHLVSLYLTRLGEFVAEFDALVAAQ